MKYLEGVKVGDRLWNIGTQDWETVTRISIDDYYQVETCDGCYTFDGYEYDSQKIVVVAWEECPPYEPPKRKVKKKGWVNVYTKGRLGGKNIFRTKEEAEVVAMNSLCTVKIEWEE